MADTHFVNPIAEGADPAVVRSDDQYLWCQSEGNVGVAIWVSDRPTTFGTKHVVWWAPDSGPLSRQVWAPELFRFDDRWYVYFAASDGDNEHHLTYVLESEGDDPLGPYAVHGPLQTGHSAADDGEPIWAIDMTVLEHGGQRYAVWSGWQEVKTDGQDLYIAPLATPTRIGGDRVQLIEAGLYDWERVDETSGSRGLAEGPQALQHGDDTFIVYSCSASWLPSYKLGLLRLIGTDPMDPAGWERRDTPLFSSTDWTCGVGHSTFTTSPDGREWWHVFHAKQDRDPGWRRAIYAQPMRWRADGAPDLGSQPVAAGAPVPIPSGTPAVDVRETRTWQFGSEFPADLDYYGHHQFIAADEAGLHLGRIPEHPVNDYRSGEKVTLRDGDYRDLRAVLDFQVVDGGHDVGLLFRTTRPAVGFDALRGYFAGVSTGRQAVVIGAMDGRSWREIASAPVFLDPGADQQLIVTAAGPTLTLHLGSDPQPLLTVQDSMFERGTVGLRVVDTHAVFRRLSLTPL